MAARGTMCLSGAVLLKAGANVSTIFTGTSAEDNVGTFIEQAESLINATTRQDYTTTYAALSADVKKLLEDIASDIAAMYCIQYDMSGYTSRSEAQTMLDVLRDAANRGLILLKDEKVQDFIDKA